MKNYSKGRTPDELVPFFPNQVMLETTLSLLLVALLLAMVIALPEGSQMPREGHYIDHPAETLWFFYPLFKLKRLTGGWLGALLIAAGAALITVTVPFMERSKEPSFRKRPVSVILILIVGIGLLYVVCQRIMSEFL